MTTHPTSVAVTDGQSGNDVMEYIYTLAPSASQYEIETFVAAIKAVPESYAHGDHEGKMAEHMGAMDLAARADATHIAIQDGDWNDPTTWYNGKIPGDDARALIPEGIHVSYETVSDARLFTLRVDGELEFATDADSRLIVDTAVFSPTSILTIGTEDDPVQSDVNVEMIFANNGAIDVEWDPMLLSRGMIAHGEVSIHGAEKDSHEKVIEDPMAGDTSVRFEEIPTGWEVGDTIVVAGTHYEGFYDWTDREGAYEPSEDEERVITAIDDDRVYFDDALVHDHDAPRADLKTSVANYTRNVSFETEDAQDAEIYERGHVMFMHNNNVDVNYAEFHELGRTDKSTDAMDAGNFDEISFDSNVKGRYSLHFHRAGTEDEDNPAIAAGNAVYGSPGWGFVHHDSHAILTNNASFNTFGAGYVAESGNETGAWHDNIAILAKGNSWADPKGTNSGGQYYENFDMARSGDGFWFQGRMVESTDNVAASVHNGFVYFHRGPLSDNAIIRFDSDTSPLTSAFHYDEDVIPDEHPILGFYGNEAFAAKTGVYVLKSWFAQDHAVQTVLEDFTAWSVRDGAELSYTGHYTLKDFDLVAREDSDLRGHWGTGIKIGSNTIDLTIVDANIEGFETGIDLHKFLLGGISPEFHNYTIVNPTFTDVDRPYINYNPALDTILDHDQLPNLTPDIALDAPLYYNHSTYKMQITGTKSDSLGQTNFSDGPNAFELFPRDVRDILEEKGYNTTSDGDQYFVLDLFFSDRITGDIYQEKHPVFIDESAGLGEPSSSWFKNVEHNGIVDLGGEDDPTSDVAELWAVLTDGQLLVLDSIYEQLGYDISNAFIGDTCYGFNTTIPQEESGIWNAYFNFANRTASTIIDADGIDTLDVSGYGANQKIDLTVQRTSQTYQNSSDIGGRTGNLTLDVGTVIENAVAGSGNDILIGNDADNILRGGAGNDTLSGFLGNDTFYGDAGFDTVVYSTIFSAFTFKLLANAIEVIGEGIDTVYNTIESFQFSDVTYSFSTILDLFGNTAPQAGDDSATVAQGSVLTLNIMANDTDANLDELTITAIEGQGINVNGTVTLASGASVTLNDNGTLEYLQNGAFDALSSGYTALDDFSYTVSDGNGGTDTASVSVTIDGVSPVSNGPIGQSGVATITQNNSAQWHTVTFDAVIENAIVVMGPMTFNGGQPGTTRVRDVTDTGFEFQIDEWTYLDGFHIEEDIGWLAMSEGSHTLSTGQTIVAGTQSVGTNFTSVDFGETLDNAVVFAEIISVNEAEAATTRIRQVDGTGFDVRVQEEENRGAHANETVSWIAFETGTATGLDAYKTGDQVSHVADSFVFNTAFDSAPVILADMQSTDGSDTASIRMSALSANGLSIFVEEEKSRDSEIAHTNETAGYVAMTEGLIFDDFAIV